MQADDALVLFPGAHDQDGTGGGLGNGDLVAGKDGRPAPRRHHAVVDLHTLGVQTPPAAFPPGRRDRAGVGEEETRVTPPGEQFVQVIVGGRAGPVVDALFELHVVQQPAFGMVDELVFLAFPQCLDGQPELLFGLIHRLVVQIRHSGVHLQHGLGDARSSRDCAPPGCPGSTAVDHPQHQNPTPSRTAPPFRFRTNRELSSASIEEWRPLEVIGDMCPASNMRSSMPLTLTSKYP